MSRLIRTILNVSLLVLPASAFAQDGEREILVSGEPLPALDGDGAYSEVTIAPEEDERPALRLEQLLSAIADFQPFRRADTMSSHPTANSLALRGLGGNAASRAPITLDGVPITDPFGGWISWNAVDPGSLSSVSVVRGGGLVSAGPGALTGAVTLKSKGADNAQEAELSYGTRDALSARGLIARSLGAGTGMIDARYDRGDGFVPVIEKQRGPVDRHSPYESASLRVRGLAPLGAGELQASAGGFYDARERGTRFTDNAQIGGQASLRYVAEGAWRVEALAYVSARAFDTGFARVQDSGPVSRAVASQALDQSTDSTGIGGKIELRPPVGAGVNLAFGADATLADGTTRELASFRSGDPRIRRVAGGKNRTFSLYAEGDWRIGNALIVTAGVRGDVHQRRDGRLIETDIGGGSPVPAFYAPDRTDEYVSGRVGANLDLGDGFAVRAAGHRSYRQPTLNELYRPYRVGADGTAANPFLDTERLTGGELGFDWISADGRAKIRITAFYAKLDSAVAEVTIASSLGGAIACAGVGDVYGTCYQRRNLDALKSRGLEVDAVYSAGRFDARLSAALTDAEVEGKGLAAPLDGMRPPQLPEAAVSLSFGWRPVEGVRLYANGQWQDMRYEDDRETRKLDGYARLDLGADYEVAEDWRIGVSARNVFDERIETGISGDGLIERAEPRTVFVTLRFGN